VLIAVLSDIHANLEALDAVLARAEQEGARRTLVLGDIVGYNADPDAVVERLRAVEDATLIGGNHDLAATGRFDVTWFNHNAEAAIRWTTSVMTDGTRELLEGLEPSGSYDEAMMVHGSVRDPAAEYITNSEAAAASFQAAGFRLCFFGHTHLPTAFISRSGGAVDGQILSDGEAFVLPEDTRALLNPGSVGQPRDGDPRASFLVFDSEARSATVHRVDYEIDRTQAKIRTAGLPDALAERLALGR
jgi:predicted phosphodiesterase